MKITTINRLFCAAIMCCLFQFTSITFGEVLFQDTFDRPDSRNIDASLVGITDNTGSSLPADGVYSQPHLDPNNDPGPEDSDPANAGGAQILSNELQLAVGPGTSNAYVNHNFTNASILAAGGFSVSLDVIGFSQTSAGQGGAFAIGMTQAEAASAGDAFEGSPNDMKFTNAFPRDFADTISDFWVGLRGDAGAELAWGPGPVGTADPNYDVVDVASKTGTISANFQLSDFNAGSAVSYEVFYNGISQGTGTFMWSDSDANYIGIDARDGTSVTLDNFIVSTVPEPSTMVMMMFVVGLFGTRRRSA